VHNFENYSMLRNLKVLRSVGKWSIGTKTECSIMNCWIETIRSAHHLVYIENQFFIGNLAGDDVVNGVPLAIADRVLQAHTQKQVCMYRYRCLLNGSKYPCVSVSVNFTAVSCNCCDSDAPERRLRRCVEEQVGSALRDDDHLQRSLFFYYSHPYPYPGFVFLSDYIFMQECSQC
jgi:hypothetical protein